MDMQATRRTATLEEVAASAICLSGPGASYIKGSIIDLSGGVLF
jgi:hypothetical protein